MRFSLSFIQRHFNFFGAVTGYNKKEMWSGEKLGEGSERYFLYKVFVKCWPSYSFLKIILSFILYNCI